MPVYRPRAAHRVTGVWAEGSLGCGSSPAGTRCAWTPLRAGSVHIYIYIYMRNVFFASPPASPHVARRWFGYEKLCTPHGRLMCDPVFPHGDGCFCYAPGLRQDCARLGLGRADMRCPVCSILASCSVCMAERMSLLLEYMNGRRDDSIVALCMLGRR